MLFSETIYICCENPRKHTNTLVDGMQNFSFVKQVVHIKPLDFKVLIKVFIR
jgi:hypothetical protein